MSSRALLVCLAFIALPAFPQDVLRAADLTGWWSADPVHAGESTHLALQFVDKDGKQEAHLSLPAIGAYDINLGEVKITGNSVDTQGLAFPLTWNAMTRSLSGHVPADAAPVYDIPVEFIRGESLAKPSPNEWR